MQRGGVRVLEIVQREQQRLLGGQPPQHGGRRQEQVEARGLTGGPGGRGALGCERLGQQAAQPGHQLHDGRAGPGGQRRQPDVVQVRAEHLDPVPEGRRIAQVPGAPAHDRVAGAAAPGQQLIEQAGLADARLAGHPDELGLTGARPVPALGQYRQLSVSTHERKHVAGPLGRRAITMP